MKERLQILLRDSWRKILLSLIAALAVEIAYLAAPPEMFYQASQQNNAVSIWNEEVQLVHCSMVDGKVVPSIMIHRFIFGDWRVKLTISSLP
ncbi:MAG: hypothetical protein V8T62_00445 [Oscillospiraceae bacterium]